MKLLRLVTLGIIVLSVFNAYAQTSANVSVFATGFNNPRGLKFGRDGNPTLPKEVRVDHSQRSGPVSKSQRRVHTPVTSPPESPKWIRRVG